MASLDGFYVKNLSFLQEIKERKIFILYILGILEHPEPRFENFFQM